MLGGVGLKYDTTIHIRQEVRQKLSELAEERGVSLCKATEDILRSALKMPPDEPYKRETGGLVVAKAFPENSDNSIGD